MLEYIRSSAQSFGVKIAFGLIILVFVFWGVGNFNDRDYSNVVAVVNGEPIVALEFEKAYHNAEEYLLRSNPGLTREQLAKQHLGRQVLRDLIQETLLAQEARRAGVTVSPLEMRNAVGQIKAFQNDKGEFDPESYKRVLQAQRLSPAQYEKNLAEQLLRDKMFALVTASAWVDPDEALHRFNFLRERRLIDYLFFPATDLKSKVSVTDADIQAYYDSHKDQFGIPPRVNAAFIEVAPAALADRSKIDEAAVKARYESEKSKYDRPEQIHLRHILAPLPQDPDEAAIKAAEERLQNAAKEIASGKSFQEVADACNEPGIAEKGGDLGWISRGQTAIPEFEEIIFALPAGKVSEPIRTPLGLHLALVEAKRPAGTAPFEEVKDEITNAIAFEEGSDKLHDVLDALIEDNILMKPIAESAAKYNLKASETGPADKNQLIQKLKIKPEGADALLATPAGAPIDAALEAGDNYIIARVLEALPAAVKPFSDVKAEIREQLIAERAQALAISEAKTALAKVKNESIAKAKEQFPGIKASEPLERAGGIPGFIPNPDLIQSIFASTLETWLPDPAAVAQTDGATGAMLVYVDKLVAPPAEEYEAIAKILGNAAKQERMEAIYEMFMQRLAQNAKVEFANTDLIDKIGQ